jgi:hypothetical protein
MFDPIGTASIALGSVVLDRPDQTGRYFAKDLAGGWAYLVGDSEGDSRFRGHGVCEGGLDTTLRCAFLSAVNCVPDCGRIRVVVETRQAHRMVVHLARRDPHVVAAIAGRPMSVLTLPEERSSHQVRSAAERAASIALRNREHAEWQAADADTDEMESSDTMTASVHHAPADTAARDRKPDRAAAGDTRTGFAGTGKLGTMRDWRAYRTTDAGRRDMLPKQPPAAALHKQPAAAAPIPDTAVRRLVGPLMERARNGLAAIGLAAAPPPRRSHAVMEWMRDFDRNVSAVTSDLQDAGA